MTLPRICARDGGAEERCTSLRQGVGQSCDAGNVPPGSKKFGQVSTVHAMCR